MEELDPDSVLDQKLRELCQENSEIAKALTEREDAEGFENGR